MKNLEMYENLIRRNRCFLRKFSECGLMRLAKSPDLDSKFVRERLLDCIQVFSNYFQKMVMLRHVFCAKKKFLSVTQEHLNEEYNHNLSLEHDRNGRDEMWDPLLEGIASWFTWKMFVLDNFEKTFLMHLVLEASANLFFTQVNGVMEKYGETKYFKIHSEADEAHEDMGYALLTELSEGDYEDLFILQHEAWDMMITICDRIAELSLQAVNVVPIQEAMRA